MAKKKAKRKRPGRKVAPPSPPESPRPPGRPLLRFIPAVADRICLELMQGRDMEDICKDPALPSAWTVYQWVYDVPEFAQKYSRAREIQADILFERIQKIADDSARDWVETDEGPLLNKDHIQRAKLRVSTLKWRIGRMAPKKYGDKIEATVKGDGTAPLQVILSPAEAKL